MYAEALTIPEASTPQSSPPFATCVTPMEAFQQRATGGVAKEGSVSYELYYIILYIKLWKHSTILPNNISQSFYHVLPVSCWCYMVFDSYCFSLLLRSSRSRVRQSRRLWHFPRQSILEVVEAWGAFSLNALRQHIACPRASCFAQGFDCCEVPHLI